MNFPLFPIEASTFALNVDSLMLFAFGIAVVFALLIAALIIFFSIKYHYSTRADRSNPPTFNLALEIIWTVIPLALVLVLYVWGSRVFVTMRQPPPNAIEMYVVGKQWMWKMQHPEGRKEINELHIPVGYPIKLLMTSEDVIHSFYVPAFRIKQDVLPGRYTMEWFEATQPGEYHLFCAQYCGTSHSGMVGKIIAMTPSDYQRWLNGPSAMAAAPTIVGPSVPAAGGNKSAATPPLNPTMVAAGEKLFKEFGCISCHKTGSGGQGPALQGLYGHTVQLEGGKTVTADESYIRESILQPNAKVVKGYKPVMPAFQGQMEEDELLQVITYIKSLKDAK